MQKFDAIGRKISQIQKNKQYEFYSNNMNTPEMMINSSLLNKRFESI